MSLDRLKFEQLCSMLQTFVIGDNRSLEFVKNIESSIVQLFPDDERFEDFELFLASYRPGGGDYLYNEEEMTQMCAATLRKLQAIEMAFQNDRTP